MNITYASLEDSWGVPTFSTPQPQLPGGGVYKSKKYQKDFLRQHRQESTIPAPPRPTPPGSRPTQEGFSGYYDPGCVLTIYDRYGVGGVLRNLPDQAIRELREVLCGGSGGIGVGIDMQTVMSLLLMGFVGLLVWDIIARIRK